MFIRCFAQEYFTLHKKWKNFTILKCHVIFDHVLLVFLLLTLNIFHTLSSVSIVDFKQAKFSRRAMPFLVSKHLFKDTTKYTRPTSIANGKQIRMLERDIFISTFGEVFTHYRIKFRHLFHFFRSSIKY